MKYFLLLLLIGCSLSPAALAQENWRKLVKKGELRFEQANFTQAAEFYYSAWQQKKSKTEYLYRAGECYANQRNYQKASQIFGELLKERTKFPLAPFYYAQSLKQEGKYEIAEVAFQDFIQNYGGNDKEDMQKRVDNELLGCQLGLKASEALPPNAVVLENPGENINTVATEFAPVPFSDDILYFSSNMKKKKVHIYRSQRKAGTWTNAVEPVFPNMPDGHFGNGTFTPDGKRF
ncbi:MAG: tetratricopeptide repeat protein [Bacteroidota bacterium]